MCDSHGGMRARFALLLLCGCAASSPVRHTIEHRASRPEGCALEVFDERHAPARQYFVLGELPVDVNQWVSREQVLDGVRPKACEAGADAIWLQRDHAERAIGRGYRMRTYRALLLSYSPAEDGEAADVRGPTAVTPAGS